MRTKLITMGIAILLLTTFSISFSSNGVKAIPVVLPTVKIISNFDGGIGVEWYNIEGTAVDDTTNFMNGTKAIKMTANNPYTDRIRFNFSTPPDLRNVKTFQFRTYTPDMANLTTHQVTFFKDYSNYMGAWVGPKMTMWASTETWFDWEVSIDAFTMVGTMYWNETNFIQISAYCQSGKSNIPVTFDQLSYRENIRDRGVISIWMDDKGGDMYDYGRSALDKYNFKASIAWTSEMGGVINTTDITKIQALHGNGYEVAYHGYQHYDLTTRTQAQLNADVTAWFNIASNYSLLSTPYIASTPYATMNRTLGEWMLENFTIIRSASSFGYGSWPFVNWFNQRGTQIDDKTLSEMKTVLNYIAEHKFHYNLIIHHIGPEAAYWNESLWSELVDYIDFKNIDVRTYTQLLAEEYYPAPVKYPTLPIMNYLIPIGAILFFSLACSLLRKRGEFSMNVFMSSTAISIGVVVWTGMFPSYTIIVSILIIIGMLFMDRG